MSIAAIMGILRALWIWWVVAAVFVGLFLAGVARGPWNYYWFFAMGCWLALDAYWVRAARTTRPIIAPRELCVVKVASAVMHTLYCLPLSSVPLLGQRILPGWMPLEIVGAFLCAAGVGFAIWARRVLAGNWNAAVGLQERHALVQAGPYAIVRHPIYLGFILMAAGLFLVLGEVRGLLCFAHSFQLFSKLKSEENLLRSTYPEEYPVYERRVKRLVPFIW